MARNFDVANICWVVQRTDVVVLHQAGRVEVRDERRSWLVGGICRVFDRIVEDRVLDICWRVKILVDAVNLG